MQLIQSKQICHIWSNVMCGKKCDEDEVDLRVLENEKI